MKWFKVRVSNNFKRVLLLLTVFVLIANNLYSQKCNLTKVKDDFASSPSVSFLSKDVTLASVFPLIGSKKPWDLVMHFLLVDGSLSISVTHQSQSYSTSLSSIFFKFQDGTIIKKEAPSTSGDYNTGLGYSYTWTGFDLTKEELMTFASKDLLKFQCSFSYFPDYPVVEQDIKNKSVEKIKRDASCILEEFNSATNVKKEEIKVIKYECKYTKDEIDAFTKKRTVYTNNEILFDTKKNGERMWFTAFGANINGVNSIQFEWGLMGDAIVDKTEVQTLLRFNRLDLLLANEKVVTLMDSEVPKFSNQSNYFISYKLFSVSDSLWDELKTAPIKKLKLSFNNEEKAPEDIDPKYAKSFMNVVNCIDALGIPKSK